jgi:hypothetical protein
MKKFLAVLASLFLVVSFATPAQSAGAKYSVYQKTLSAFSSTATTLTAQQKAQVKAAVDANPTAEKFICTGIRYYSQPMDVNIMVRKRAKAACEYAKQLNPELSTWYQNKPTQARSYAGKVLLTVKTLESANEITESHNLTGELAGIGEPNVYQHLYVPSDSGSGIRMMIFQYVLSRGYYYLGLAPENGSGSTGRSIRVEFDLNGDDVWDQKFEDVIPASPTSRPAETVPSSSDTTPCNLELSRSNDAGYIYLRFNKECFGDPSSIGVRAQLGNTADGYTVFPSADEASVNFKPGWRDIFACNKYRHKMILEEQGQPWSCGYVASTQNYEWNDSIGAAQVYSRTKIERAYYGCLSNGERQLFAKLADNGKTLTLYNAFLYGVQSNTFDCITRIVNLPDSDYDSIMRTRAIDGTKRAQWLNRTAEWTYHPSTGLSITFTEK